MSDRLCQNCQELKLSKTFHGTNCRDCFNIKQKVSQKQRRRKDKIIRSIESANEEPQKLNEIDMRIYKEMTDATSLIVTGNSGDDYHKFLEKINDIVGIVERANFKSLVFPYKISNQTFQFLNKVAESGNDIGSAETMIRKNLNDPNFLKLFGIDSQQLDNIYDEVINIKDTTDALRVAYNVMVNDYNKNVREMTRVTGSCLLTKKREYCDAVLDLYSHELVIEPNELQLDETEFIHKLQELITADCLEIKGFASVGAYDSVL